MTPLYTPYSPDPASHGAVVRSQAIAGLIRDLISAIRRRLPSANS